MAAVASPAAGYIWEDPGDSIMIRVSLDLVERLGAAVQQGLGTGPRGSEIGGLLLGRPLPGFGRAVSIEDFELVRCEHLRGASYTLSPGERHMLGGQLRRRRSLPVVGFFRSHTRPGLYLDQDDFTVFDRYFQDAGQVFLLVRPATDGPAIGGFFFWEDGELNRRSPYRQFPFDCARLAEGDFPITGGPPAVAAAPRPAPVLVAKPLSGAPRKLPPLPWMVVPVIAVLFLVAGVFVSETQPSTPAVAAPKTSLPVEPLLPEPVPEGAAPPVVGTPAEDTTAAAHDVSAQPTAAPPPLTPVAKPKVQPSKALPTVAAIPPAAPPTPSREVEQPPVLAAPVERLEPKLPAVFHPRVTAAPPPVADVSYEAPRPGVFRRAFHKIEGVDAGSAGFVAPSPIRKVAPVRPAGSGSDLRPVDVKVFIDDAGNVSRAQVLTKGSDLATTALNAARQWQFTPARKHDRAVSSEMVLHFRF